MATLTATNTDGTIVGQDDGSNGGMADIDVIDAEFDEREEAAPEVTPAPATSGNASTVVVLAALGIGAVLLLQRMK